MEARFDLEHHEEDFNTTPENTSHDSSISGEEAAEEAYTPMHKKSRRGTTKKVVTVPIGDGDGSRSRGEVYPPPDSWSWRKYGQKPIKGSPYPRGYYKCSSSKGCPSRKQVERSRLDPTTILITYTGDHNHQHPTTTTATTGKNNHHRSTPTATPPANFPPEEHAAFANQPDIEPSFAELSGEFGWLCEVGSTMMDGTTLVGPASVDFEIMEVGSTMIGEEDELLYGDLGDLPECSFVFRRIETLSCGGTG